MGDAQVSTSDALGTWPRKITWDEKKLQRLVSLARMHGKKYNILLVFELCRPGNSQIAHLVVLPCQRRDRSGHDGDILWWVVSNLG